MKEKRVIITSIISILILSSQFFAVSLNGNYTINASGSGSNNYTTISAAVADLYSEGISGNVIFDVIGTFNEQIDLNGAIAGSSKFNQITFQASSLGSGIVEFATSPTNNFVIRIINAQYINFKNLKILIDQQPGDEGNVVYSDSPQGNIKFESNQFKGIDNAPSGSLNSAIVYVKTLNSIENINGFSFIENEFINGTYGLYLYSHSANLSTGLLVSGNVFTTQHQPIYIRNFDSPDVISNIVSNQSDEFAIFLENCIDNFKIDKNKITSNGNYSSGIKLNNCVSNGSRGRITNNFIQTHLTGILLGYAENIDLFFNSVNIQNTSNSIQTNSTAIKINTSCNHLVLLNNIFANKRDGLAFDGGPQIDISNYNSFFSTSTTTLAKWATSLCANLYDLISSNGYLFELNSKQIDPNFTSLTDLHTNEPQLHKAGTQIAAITADIDNNLRVSAKPCIGADEFYLPLLGTYTIGSGSNVDYSTISSAVSDLYLSEINGPVIFKIKDGQYNEQINLDGSIVGSSPANTVTFESYSGFHGNVNIKYAANSSVSNYVLRINEAKYLKFKNLTFTADGTTYAKVVSLENPRGHLEFYGNVINGYSEATTVEQDLIQMAGIGYIEYLNVSNNILSNGNIGIYLNSNTIYSDSVKILNNTFSTNGSSLNMKKLRYLQIIKNNIVHSSGSNPAIVLINSPVFNIALNNISSINTQYGAAIELNSSSGIVGGALENRSKIINNFIQSSSAGIVNNHSSYVDIFYNTVNIENEPKTDKSNSYGIINQVYSNHISIKNNIINNYRAGFAIYNLSSSTLESNYNNLYTTGAILVKQINDEYTTLSDWQAAPGANDAMSYSSVVTFESLTDLHIKNVSEPLLGTALTEVADDIDGDSRNNPPFIGADEPILDISELTLKIFLEGTFNTVSHKMNSVLTIPLTSPYSEHYKTVSTIPPTAVDWVLVKLLDEDYNTVVTQSAFLMADGFIYSSDGSSSLKFLVDTNQDYFVVVEHRNHLSVMSANPILFN